jgi:23S rRNA (uracil1939-C5)-methyltransferase
VTKLTIEKMVYGGDGLARMEDDSGRNKAVFVPFVLPGEEVEAKVSSGRGFARASAEKIVSASANRVPAPCPYFQQCGGCHYQHADYKTQLEIKINILRETLLRTAKFDWQHPIHTHSADPWHYRNRTRMKVQAAKGAFSIGYYRMASHQLLAAEQCPISSPMINRALTALWQLGGDSAVPASIVEIEFFANAEDTQLMLELYLSADAAPGELPAFADRLKAAVPEATGFAAFAGLANQPAKKSWQEGAEELVYRTAADTYHVRAGSFFQTNRFLTDKLVELVTANQKGEIALDLYAGTGLFSLPLARTFKKVVAVEAAPDSYADLRTNAPTNTDCHRDTTEDFLRRNTKVSPDLVVADPPRAGLGNKVTTALNKIKAQYMVYVSCDPATLARDLQELISGGYKIQSVDLIDLFPQTFHMETVVHMSR